ncbi:arylsulfatase B isoform X2 [Harpegnathos saltator]|uniref:Arylsulfatase B n=2 Tax=Harpegnathos saltator TaxID=610380 RepID=E2CA34_HARSA|nr:arylsulfatase B isoform X2 [Harpegnathos saltator]XP_011153379.1 arylsulfatase B isoform X2 [Harpegnathos saltator]XP_019700814.1 arylsulfatase B isoform X2 [Harpegnathos saltator]XP_019700817.1 arylsulfatase B isoform X2 [Harpegnathos saltator]EFN75189.1 Arylsulfatase B [Harpegnathos saltator]
MSKLLLKQLLFTLCLVVILVPVGVIGTLESGATEESVHKKPHIIIILADDLGWNDVSFHGSNQIPTPNIDALAYYGVLLKNHYVAALCTPSRAALLTGKYPIHLGMQHEAIFPSEPRGLPLEEKLLPQYLKDMNYVTHIVGKWHLGYYKMEYTPLYRGFDTHFGYWNGLQDYYSHKTAEPYTLNIGMDMRRNFTVAWDTMGKYSVDLYTDEAVRLINTHNTDNPMFLYLAQIAPHAGNANQLPQALPEEIEKFSYIIDPKRKRYAAVVSKLDESVGKVVEALKNRNMLSNSIILFMSDNGAPTSGFLSNGGSNYPFRGIKKTLWEGGVRGAAAIWSPLIKKRERVSYHLMHVTDWLPTLLSAAGGNKEEIGTIDGLDMWETIVYGDCSPRKEVLINIDDICDSEAIRIGKYKYVRGESKKNNDWVGDSGRNSSEQRPPYSPETVLNSKVGIAIASLPGNNNVALTSAKMLELRQQAEVHCNVTEEEKVQCDTQLAPCLFDLERDPCEMINIIKQEPLVAKELQEVLLQHRSTMLLPNNRIIDVRASPILWNCTWVCWMDDNPMAYAHTNEIAADAYLDTHAAI